MLFGYLDLQQQPEPRLSARFRQLIQERGSSVDFVSMADCQVGTPATEKMQHWDRILETADVYLIEKACIPDYPKSINRIREAILGGKSAFIEVDPNSFDAINPLLAHFGMISTPLIIANTDHSASQSLVRFERESGCLRGLNPFTGVQSITVATPRVVWYLDQAVPLVVATGEQFIVSDEDLTTQHDPRQCACVVGWCGDRGQAVIVASGGLFHDPYDGTGVHWPGISENIDFGRSLLEYFARSRTKQAPQISGDGLCDRIETNLARTVLEFVKGSAASDWWTEFVPLTIRQKCSSRKEEEGNRFPPEAYLDLSDLKVIIEKNWALFEKPFRAAQAPERKADALAWIDVLNSKYRRFAAHPLKRMIAGFQYSADDMAFLIQWDSFTFRLLGLLVSDKR